MLAQVYHPMPTCSLVESFSRFSACSTGENSCNYSLDPPKSGEDSDQMFTNITAYEKHDSGEPQTGNEVSVSSSTAEIGADTLT